MVTREVFVTGLRKVIADFKDDDEKVLLYILGMRWGVESLNGQRGSGTSTCVPPQKSSLFEQHLQTLNYVLFIITDNTNSGMINQHKFSEFLKGFGPVREIIKNVSGDRWFPLVFATLLFIILFCSLSGP
jgi:hypothetical protein